MFGFHLRKLLQRRRSPTEDGEPLCCCLLLCLAAFPGVGLTLDQFWSCESAFQRLIRQDL